MSNPAATTAQHHEFNQALASFIDASPSPFHATSELAKLFKEAGFHQLYEGDEWALKTSESYYVTRNDSSIIAWTQSDKPLAASGWRMLGAHTDSPCLRIKPQPDLTDQGYWRLGVEVYGGALLNPWFDRDLSIAGRVHYRNKRGIAQQLINFKQPIAVIPSLAIHLDREANKKRSIDAQQHLPVILAANPGCDQYQGFNALVLAEIQKQDPDAQALLEHELSFYDTQAATIIGVGGDFIASARLDNLLSCYVDAQALIGAKQSSQWSLLVCSDHEEVGSASAAGAGGPFLQQVLQRIESQPSEMARGLSRSVLISTDNAHALHPNYANKMDKNHAPMVNGGPVIKVNANQRYASNSETQALFKILCEKNNVPLQHFVMRSDMACGSTIGPITAAEIGIKTLDVGLPTFAMHSIRELAGSRDALHLLLVLTAFLNRVE
jgi:aspartyl aminopeptidase